MSFFPGNDKAFSHAISLSGIESDLLTFIGSLVDSFVFESVKVGLADFHDTMKAQESKLKRASEDETIAAAQLILDGLTITKGIKAILDKFADKMSEGDLSAGVSFTMADGSIVVKVIDPRARVASGKAESGKAMLDGKVLTATVLREDYPDTVAGRIALNKMKPFGIVKMKNGGNYSPNSQMNATQAVNADSVLKSRLTFE